MMIKLWLMALDCAAWLKPWGRLYLWVLRRAAAEAYAGYVEHCECPGCNGGEDDGRHPF